MVTRGPVTSALAESLEMLHRLAATADIAQPRLEVAAKSPRLARVDHRPDGFWVVFHPVLLSAPVPARTFVLAHEIAHMAMGHRLIRRRLTFALIAAIPLMGIGFFAVLGSQLVTETQTWLLTIESVIFIAAMLSPRAIILAVARRHEYQADRMAATLLGGVDPGVAFFDWVSVSWRPAPQPMPLRLWGSTHPCNAARRRELLGGAR